MPSTAGNALETAADIVAERYPGAIAAFLCGSVVRAEATEFSDLDVVIVFERVDQACRESFRQLYPALATHFFRSRGLWSAKGKSIPRRLHSVDPAFAGDFEAAFSAALDSGTVDALVDLCERVLAPSGGWLFAGFERRAPADWRMPI